MKNLTTVLFVFLFTVPCIGQWQKSDREMDELKGLVKNIKSISGEKFYDRKGYLTSSVSRIGNCFITNDHTFTDIEGQVRVKLTVMDGSSLGFCGRRYDALRDKNGEVFYTLSYSWGYNYDDYDEKSRKNTIMEVKRFGTNIKSSYTRFFDDKSRLVKDLFINDDFIARMTIYNYTDNQTNPVTAEFFINTVSVGKEWYRYDEFDKQGNWTQRTTTKTDPETRGDLTAIKRVIAYY